MMRVTAWIWWGGKSSRAINVIYWRMVVLIVEMNAPRYLGFSWISVSNAVTLSKIQQKGFGKRPDDALKSLKLRPVPGIFKIWVVWKDRVCLHFFGQFIFLPMAVSDSVGLVFSSKGAPFRFQKNLYLSEGLQRSESLGLKVCESFVLCENRILKIDRLHRKLSRIFFSVSNSWKNVGDSI